MADEVEEQQTPEPEQVAESPAPVQQAFDWEAAHREQQRQIAILAQNVASLLQQQQRPAPQAAPQADATDEDLWTRAQQGDRGAFERWQERIAERTAERKVAERMAAQGNQQAVAAQIQMLFSQYPEFADNTHPRTIAANRFYAALVGMGSPQGPETQLQAMLRAAADKTVVAVPAQRAATTSRPSAAGQLNVSHQAPSAPATEARATHKDHDLARKMGIKDPNKALDRFWKRQAEGKSSVSPLIASALNQDGNR